MILISTANQIYVLDQLIAYLFDVFHSLVLMGFLNAVCQIARMQCD